MSVARAWTQEWWKAQREQSKAGEPRSVDFRVWIHPVKHPKWDYRVVVQRLTDGVTKTERVSGGEPILEATVNRLAHELGLPQYKTL